MPRASKAVREAKEKAKAAEEALAEERAKAREEKAKRRPAVPKGIPAAAAATAMFDTGNEEPVAMTEEQYVAGGRVLDPQSAKAYARVQEYERRRQAGESVQGLHFNLPEEDRYALCYVREGNSGHMKVRLLRVTPNEAELGDIAMRSFPTLADVRAHVRETFWDGRETLIHWECRSLRAGAHAQGDLRFPESPEQVAKWEERRVRAEQRSREVSMAAAVGAVPGQQPGVPYAGVPMQWPGMPGVTFTPQGLQIGGMPVPAQALTPDVITMLAQAAIGKSGAPQSSATDPIVQMAIKALEARLTQPQVVQQPTNPFGGPELVKLLEIMKDKPADQQMTTMLVELVKTQMTAAAQPKPAPAQEDPLNQIKRVVDVLGALTGGSPFGQKKGSEVDEMIAATQKAKTLAEALGFKSKDEKDDDDSPVVKDKDGKVDGVSTVVKLLNDNVDTIGGGFRFLIEKGMEQWERNKAEKKAAEERIIRLRQAGDFAKAQEAQREKEIADARIAANEKYLSQLREAQALQRGGEIHVREVPSPEAAPDVTPKAQAPSPAPTPAPTPAPRPVAPADDDDELEFYGGGSSSAEGGDEDSAEAASP